MLAAVLTARDHVGAGTAMLTEAGVDSPRADAEWLLAGLLAIGRAELRLRLDRVIAPTIVDRYAVAVGRRARREPLQRILGWEEFRGLRLRLTDDVLVPRPETELLAGWALELLPPPPARPLAVDVGTGSGCVACALAAERTDAHVIATDRSASAAAVARDNARALGLDGRVSVAAGDLLGSLRARADVIVSNPPYLPGGAIDALTPEVARWDPRAALDGGPDGLVLIRALIAAAPASLAPGGALVLETGGGAQIEAARAWMRAAGFVETATRVDLTGVVRFVAGRVD
ncbi:MAG TPA: peptide chain release factor N(5)-glutamine methyltransferase [Methylomirabilota bacterium]|jgi:release factor glutamine methyltransferase|nr:peptide chain release factor N(5)-glutamine methyltransferase [Methylomirabilota bacterium]HEV8615712.1 peptide chain release factor N(5)-glutamine methyltransferase [Methylomirabilota bacterium]